MSGYLEMVGMSQHAPSLKVLLCSPCGGYLGHVLNGAPYNLWLSHHFPAVCSSHSDDAHTCLFNRLMAFSCFPSAVLHSALLATLTLIIFLCLIWPNWPVIWISTQDWLNLESIPDWITSFFGSDSDLDDYWLWTWLQLVLDLFSLLSIYCFS